MFLIVANKSKNWDQNLERLKYLEQAQHTPSLDRHVHNYSQVHSYLATHICMVIIKFTS